MNLIDSQIRKGFVNVVCRKQCLLLGIPDNDLIIRLPRCMDQLQCNTGQSQRQSLVKHLGRFHIRKPLSFVQSERKLFYVIFFVQSYTLNLGQSQHS